MSGELVFHRGGCHCGKVTYNVIAPRVINAVKCNCSICEMKGFLHLIVPASQFKLSESSYEFLACYTFNTHVAKHYFCKVCGIASFYIPRSNPDGFDVNVNCLSKDNIDEIKIEEFDGRNWEKNAASLAHLSKEKQPDAATIDNNGNGSNRDTGNSQTTTTTKLAYTPFHWSFGVKDLQSTRDFYGGVLQCREGRSTDTWVDFDFFGHQISCHLSNNITNKVETQGHVDGIKVPIPHFGAVLEWSQFWSLAERVKAHNIGFVIEPYIRFEGQTGEQAVMFFMDPSNNALEFKAFKDPAQIFASSSSS